MKKPKNGFIKLDRKLIEWEWFQDQNVLQVWIYCLLMANWETNKWKGTVIERGSFATSLQHICEDTGLTSQKVRTSLEKLEKSGCITKKATNRFTVINVLKYSTFQGLREQEQQTNNKQITNKQQTGNNKLRRIKKNKEEIRNIPSYVVPVPDYITQQMNGTLPPDKPADPEKIKAFQKRQEEERKKASDELT